VPPVRLRGAAAEAGRCQGLLNLVLFERGKAEPNVPWHTARLPVYSKSTLPGSFFEVVIYRQRVLASGRHCDS
jgi:hypothetical protein